MKTRIRVPVRSLRACGPLHLVLLLAAALPLAGCGHYTILAVPAISMTTPSMPPGSAAVQAGRVSSEFCPGDAPNVSHDDNVGLIDEAVARAQQKAGAEFLTDVSIASDGMCVFVDAMAMRVVAPTAAPPGAPPPPPTAAPPPPPPPAPPLSPSSASL